MIVVTAAGGRTGTAVVRALRARGEQVRAVVTRWGPRPELTGLLDRRPRTFAEHLGTPG